MTTSTAWHILPPDLIELQLGQIDLLLAMYPDEITLEESSQNTIDNLRSLEDKRWEELSADAPLVPITLQVTVSEFPTKNTLDLNLTVLFYYEGIQQPEDPPSVKVRTRQPPWLSRAATTQLVADLPPEEDLLGTIEHIKSAASEHLDRSSTAAASSSISTPPPGSLVRVWFYFPSISTRSKRDDFIIHAPTHHLTGFLYAGKPGLLCVEGSSQSIDDYMKFIKTESWGDIPAHHKKVSERYREPDVERVFSDMAEITDSVGERRGQRVNRGDMKAVEEWLVERGLGEAFARVLM
jgi:hypothetical protein